MARCYNMRIFYLINKQESGENMMTILYKVHNNIYINMTNKCTCSCTFCLRQNRDEMENSGSLWLDREPTVEEVIEEFSKWDVDKYDEIVFCGFGEPTMRLHDLIKVAEYLKANYNKPIRINTNGLANLYYNKDVTPLFKDKIDIVSISLNTPNKERYYELTRNRFGIEGFDGMLEFAKGVKKYVPQVILSTVETTLTKEEEEQCASICNKLGVTYRIRPWED